MITEKERQDLIADARRMVRETNFCADMCLRFASDAEHDVRAREIEQKKLRDMARRFIAKHGRPPREPLPAGHLAQIIPFPPSIGD
jgi:hypothetical protein